MAHRRASVKGGSFSVEASTVVPADADEVLAFVLDVDRYRQADHKIRRVRRLRRDGDDLVVSMRTRFRGLPVLVTQRMRLTPSVRIDVHNEPSWQDRFTTFHGEFVCEPVGAGTRVTHRYTFAFTGPARFAAPLLRGWIARDMEAEVTRVGTIFGAAHPSGDPA